MNATQRVYLASLTKDQLIDTLDEAKAALELFARAFPYEREFVEGSVQWKAIVATKAVLAKLEPN